MNLQEILKSLELTDENIKAINAAVDVVIDSKVKTKDDELEKIKGDFDKLNGELKPFKAKARNEKIKSLLPKTANAEMFDDIIALAKLDDDDNDETITKKLTDTISKRDFLQVIEDVPEKRSVLQTKTKTEEPKKEYRFVNKGD